MTARSKRNVAIKAAINYDPDVPRCDSCTSFRQAGTHLVNSIPRFHHARCVKHGFQPKACGCCDTWQGRDGDTLTDIQH